jgi:hypothetical protein
LLSLSLAQKNGIRETGIRQLDLACVCSINGKKRSDEVRIQTRRVNPSFSIATTFAGPQE